MTTTAAGDKSRGLLNINHMPLRTAIGNMCFTSGTLAIGTSKAKFDTTTTINYSIGGVLKIITALTSATMIVASSDDGSTTQAIGTTCWYVACINSAGTYEAYKGEDDVTTVLPSVPNDVCPFGLIKVVNATNVFTMGTTNYDASGVTSTFTNISVMPVSPP